MAANNPALNFITDLSAHFQGCMQETETNPNYKNMVVQYLRDRGYDYFGEIENADIENDHMKKILTLAIHDAVKTKRNPPAFGVPVPRSPLDLAEDYDYDNVGGVKDLIKDQFEIQWYTQSGQPEPFTYYEFCNANGTTDLLQYNPRRENVFVQLYRECMVKQRTYTKEQLCPPVYVKAWPEGWMKWNAEQDTIERINEDDLNWIQEPIRQFVLESADEMQTLDALDTDERLKWCLSQKATVYLAVIDDTDFPNEPDGLNLNNIGKTQVYVGTTKTAIRKRWLTGSSSHTEMIKKCLDNANAMTTYDPLRLEGIQLVQARLALAKLRDENCALFLMKTCNDDQEKALLEFYKTLLDGNGVPILQNVEDPEEEEIVRRLRVERTSYINGEINILDGLLWSPRNMAYGMNGQ